MTTIDPTISQTPVVSNIDPAVSDSELRPHLHVHSVTLTGLFILAVFFTLHLGRVIFLPITIALLFAVLFAPLLRRLKQLHIPEPVGAAILLSLVLATLGYGVSRLAEPAADWAARVPDAFREAEYKLRVVKKPMQEVTKATELISKAANWMGPKKVQQVEVKGDAWPMKIFSVTGEFVAGFATTLILLYFLLSSGDLLPSETREGTASLAGQEASSGDRARDRRPALSISLHRHLYQSGSGHAGRYRHVFAGHAESHPVGRHGRPSHIHSLSGPRVRHCSWSSRRRPDV